MAANAAPLHVFFLPFPAAGHSIPMLNVAALFTSRGATSTVVLLRANDDSADSTSNSNRCGGGDNDDNDDNGGLRFLSLPFSYAAAGIAEGEVPLPSAYATPEFEAALDAVGEPFLELLKAHRPDCVVADLQIPFAAEHAAALAIPHLTLQVTCAFSLIVMGIINHAKPHLGVASPSEPFVVPGLPHRIELTPAQLPSHLTAPVAAERNRRILAAQRGGGGGGGGCSLGMILNTFRALEPAYVDMLRRAGRFSAWCVGPISSSAAARRRRRNGDRSAAADGECLRWLDRYEGPPGSVLFLCFGSQGRFTRAQRRELARGLAIASVPFVWVVNKGEEDDDDEEEEEEEERIVRVSGLGLVVRGWAPQVEALAHPAVGGFATHCGWNSCAEGIAAGAAMVTWPLYAEQFVNERLLVDVVGTGAPVGARVWSDRAEERGLVAAEAVAAAISRVMGDGAEAEGRRRRAREIAEEARRAVAEGGTASDDMAWLVAEILRIKEEKKKKMEEEEEEEEEKM
ncbi:anthocyanin 3'-O-beta-glucosyltransferase-like [Ananas comosus]|uniref:Anthocyanin 3'-O-beta-glucosyltransferase-like n=1 Tax=Ananas comosus TaxID=4615 RepID=A0A6P5FTR6_ANACO|nr:anthocyanin 3'-O-beta-glucosyltransferase-like [Ananas comosus]